jgi:hypothetical protein
MAERRVEEVKKELELVHETMERQDDGTNYDNKPGIVGGFIIDEAMIHDDWS